MIEDEFYQSQPGTASPAQAQARPESFYVLTKQEISSKGTQVIAGYSSILDARLGIEDNVQPIIHSLDTNQAYLQRLPVQVVTGSTTTRQPYYRYDPFSFQCCARSKHKYAAPAHSNIYSHRLDSRFSLEVVKKVGKV